MMGWGYHSRLPTTCFWTLYSSLVLIWLGQVAHVCFLDNTVYEFFFRLVWTRDCIKFDHSITFVKRQIQAGLLDGRGPGIKLCGPKAQMEIWHVWAMPYLFFEIVIENNGIIRFWWGERCCKWCPWTLQRQIHFPEIFIRSTLSIWFFPPFVPYPHVLGCTGFSLSWNNSGNEQSVGAQFLYIERLLFTKCRNVHGITAPLYAF